MLIYYQKDLASICVTFCLSCVNVSAYATTGRPDHLTEVAEKQNLFFSGLGFALNGINGLVLLPMLCSVSMQVLAGMQGQRQGGRRQHSPTCA